MSSEVKVALITGAGSGIGKHAALALLGEGYSLVLAGRRMERVDETIADAGAAASRARLSAAYPVPAASAGNPAPARGPCQSASGREAPSPCEATSAMRPSVLHRPAPRGS